MEALQDAARQAVRNSLANLYETYYILKLKNFYICTCSKSAIKDYIAQGWNVCLKFRNGKPVK